MSRLQNVKPEQAQGKLAETYGAIKQQMGGVINLFQALGNSNEALNGYLAVGGLLKSGHLSATELETIALVSAQANGCEYCTSAHTTLGKMSGLSAESMVSIRKGQGENEKSSALVSFVREAIGERGRVSDQTLGRLKHAGFSDAQIPEIFLAISQNLYTNYFNNFNQTVVDFPAAPKI